MIINANIVDVVNGRCYFGTCLIDQGKIVTVTEEGAEREGVPYLMPGFIDAHVHIESSMLVPTEFARLAVRHGTVATVSDPHEIANVLGVAGVEYMLRNATQSPLKFNFGVPSCVPATTFETAGATLDSDIVKDLLVREELCYLAEMMNYPGVLYSDPEVMKKIAAAKECGKPIDGHAPALTGDDAIRYIAAGISTDHECVSYPEAQHKLRHGMKIIIREGSAARNFEALHPLISEHPEMVMLCSDDKHPDDLVAGHINELAATAVKKGHRWQDVLKAACVNPVLHYGLKVGLLREGDPADAILVNDLIMFHVIKTIIDGVVVYEEGKEILHSAEVPVVNQFNTTDVDAKDFSIKGVKTKLCRVIRAIDGSLLTGEMHLELNQDSHGCYMTDVECDVLKIAVVNRYQRAEPAVAFIHGFGLKQGAVASSVAHDSHNIVAVGVDDESLACAINLVIGSQGGIVAIDASRNHEILALPVGGIISDQRGEEVARMYTAVDNFAKVRLGSTLRAPFMTLSFMALLVIPQLKLSDKGLFDGGQFRFVDLAV